jgi:uncharacterized protein YdhG (YjbR/CyaY superfamily)
MKTTTKTVTEYLNSLPPDRKKVLAEVRKVIKKNLPKGYVETINWGMIAYEIPLKRYPNTYNKKPLMFLALASQKNHLALYLMCTYGNKEREKWFKNAWKKAGKKLDMGKSCLRFQTLEDLSLEVIGELVAQVPVDAYIETYERTRKM